MSPVKLYLLHINNINLYYDLLADKKEELASRVPGCATLKHGFLLNCLWCIVVVLEPFVSLFLITVYLPLFLSKAIIKKKQTPGNHIALCYHGLTKQRVKMTPEVDGVIDYYLYPVFVDKQWVAEGEDRHSVFEAVNMCDVLMSYFMSLVTIIAATIKTHGKYLYRNHLSFEYILTWFYLKKVSKRCTLYFVNHLDRWAVLFNYAPQENKVLLQHGIEVPMVDWPIKLTKVGLAYLFSESQIESMEKGVLGHKTEYRFMPPTVKLTQMESSKQYNVLIIACDNYMYYNQEEYVIKNIVSDNLMIYVKIHPGKNDYQKYEELKSCVNPNIEIITTATFPKVDAVVSYYSTLGLEYGMHHIPVYYYDEVGLDAIVYRIKTMINK